MSDGHAQHEELFAHLLGELGPGESELLTAHLEACAECRAMLARVEAVRSVIQADNAAGPSAAALARVKDLMANRKPTRALPSPIDSIRRVFAPLTFDSRQGYAMAGLRGSADSYLLTYEHGDIAFDLEIEPPMPGTDAPWHVTGQFASSETPLPAAVTVIGGRGLTVTASCDEHGVFSITLEPGDYDLQIVQDREVIVFPEIDVG
jgi:anti-sigma factor RsiW